MITKYRAVDMSGKPLMSDVDTYTAMARFIYTYDNKLELVEAKNDYIGGIPTYELRIFKFKKVKI